MIRVCRFPFFVGVGVVVTALALPAQDPEVPADTDQKTTDSGLKYSVLKKGGPGESPQMGDKVKVHYTGWLTDGTMFDSSRQRGNPSEFSLGQVIQGWNEGLQLMTPGARFKFTIPYNLAYGENGRPPTIPPKSTLIFDVELLSFVAMPRFKKLDPDAAKTTDSGIKYQVLDPGEGKTPTAEDPLEFQFALWNTEGKLLQASAQMSGAMQGKASDMRIDFLKEALVMMKPGERTLFEVPAKLAFGEQNQGPDLPPNSVTVWQLELVRVNKPLAVPAFVMPKEEELKTTASGLKYKVVKEGKADGASPAMGQTVKVHYAGWLTDGTPFDDSFSRGVPSEFRLGQVIGGWNEGLQLMKPGGVAILVIPGDLAYGQRGSPPKIGPNATLVFRIELIDVVGD